MIVRALCTALIALAGFGPDAHARGDRILSAGGFHLWVASFWPRAEARGVSRKTYDAAFAVASFDGRVLVKRTRQAEHVRSYGDYLKGALRAKRMTLGRQMVARHSDLLAQVERDTGVDRHIVLAIWGLESTFGTGMGTRNVFSSLGTQAYARGTRTGFAERQLIAALKLVDDEQLDPASMVGSWAGAVGHTQFMPTTYAAYAVDGDGDRRRDLWRSLPDALMSAGVYLKRARWKPGVRWGVPVTLPEGFDYAATGLGKWRPLGEWIGAGVVVRAEDAAALGADASLLVPAGYRGPAFLVSRNFRVLLRYNNATKYALAVGHLADAFAGRAHDIGDWPQGMVRLSRKRAADLQRRLTQLGYDTGGIDGILGTNSRRSLQAFQTRIGVPADGYLDPELLTAIMSAKPPAGTILESQHETRAAVKPR